MVAHKHYDNAWKNVVLAINMKQIFVLPSYKPKLSSPAAFTCGSEIMI